jgi:choline monooxygenase
MIDPDIRRASTLPGEFYGSEETYARVRESVLLRSWLFLAHREQVAGEGLYPCVLGAGSLDEPVVLSRTDALRCFSNVCTHRGAILLEQPCPAQNIRCRYHGRRFDPRGRFLSMPEFEGAEDFPSERDHLPEVRLGSWGPLIFASLDPAIEFAQWIAPLPAGLDSLAFAGERTYEVDASWALYCDNYLEGFHIPYVHPGLADALDYSEYRIETFDHASLQTGPAKDPSEPPAYYFFLFPATMVNVYPWGISLNVVEPLGVARTRIRFLTFVGDASKTSRASGDLHTVELEDEAIVASVQCGIRSRLYRRGRYSPSREIAVHHFHRLLSDYLSSGR